MLKILVKSRKSIFNDVDTHSCRICFPFFSPLKLRTADKTAISLLICDKKTNNKISGVQRKGRKWKAPGNCWRWNRLTQMKNTSNTMRTFHFLGWSVIFFGLHFHMQSINRNDGLTVMRRTTHPRQRRVQQQQKIFIKKFNAFSTAHWILHPWRDADRRKTYRKCNSKSHENDQMKRL